MGYFIVRSGEDGTNIERVTEEELLKRITPDADGYTWYGEGLTFLPQVPQSDKGCWMTREENPLLVIKGEIIVPRATEVVTKYRVE